VISLQCGFGLATSKTPVAIAFAERFELLGGKDARAGMPRCSPLATIVGLGLPDFLGVTLSPLLAAGYYFFALALVVSKLRSSYLLLVVSRPTLFVLRYLFFTFFLVFSTRLDPMGQVCPGFLILSVLL
jgi:hypothetical protein